MQYIRERLSLSLSANHQTNNGSDIVNGSTSASNVPDTPPKPPARKIRDGAKLSEVIISPTISTISESTSQQESVWIASRNIDVSGSTLGSTYATPYQSPVASEKWPPHSTITSQQPKQNDSDHFNNQNRFNGYPQTYSTPIAGGYANHSFADSNGSAVSNPNRNSQAHVIHEQYWSWSCKCRRQLSNREKALLLVICFLLLIIGGLSAYLGLSDNGNPLPGGLLTPGMLQVRKPE